jgi:DNA-binding HxlR family transcriptional regulator
LDYPSQGDTLADVPSPIGYQTFCPVGAALNVVGERWALLIVRDLLLGPRRYSELVTGLGGVGTDILAARLRTLQEHGIVRQIGSGRARRYELTESGEALRPVLTELARWGADRLSLPDDLSEIPPRVPLSSLLLGAGEYPRSAHGVFEIRVDDHVVRVAIDRRGVHPAADGERDAVIVLSRAGLRALIFGVPAEEIEAREDLSIEGARRRARSLLDVISGPPLLAGLRRDLEAADDQRV